jgi:hypothetical protein
MRRFILVMTLFAAACGEHKPQVPVPPAPPDAAVAACDADESHCCLASGEVVVPGGCQPVVREGTYPNVERNDDGTCREIPCQLRCLPATARIATPRGEIAVSDLAIGDPVWTVGACGGASRAGPAGAVAGGDRAHQIVELTLADGRVVELRPATARDFRHRRHAAAGAVLDGTTVGRPPSGRCRIEAPPPGIRRQTAPDRRLPGGRRRARLDPDLPAGFPGRCVRREIDPAELRHPGAERNQASPRNSTARSRAWRHAATTATTPPRSARQGAVGDPHPGRPGRDRAPAEQRR